MELRPISGSGLGSYLILDPKLQRKLKRVVVEGPTYDEQQQRVREQNASALALGIVTLTAVVQRPATEQPVFGVNGAQRLLFTLWVSQVIEHMHRRLQSQSLYTSTGPSGLGARVACGYSAVAG
jgi:hypothetical protein